MSSLAVSMSRCSAGWSTVCANAIWFEGPCSHRSAAAAAAGSSVVSTAASLSRTYNLSGSHTRKNCSLNIGRHGIAGSMAKGSGALAASSDLRHKVWSGLYVEMSGRATILRSSLIVGDGLAAAPMQ